MVVPVHDEAANIAPLIAEIDAALSGRIAFEIVYVDDDSGDASAEEFARTRRRGRRRHGRYITFQLAEVAITRTLFAEMLRRIDGLRPAPVQP